MLLFTAYPKQILDLKSILNIYFLEQICQQQTKILTIYANEVRDYYTI